MIRIPTQNEIELYRYKAILDEAGIANMIKNTTQPPTMGFAPFALGDFTHELWLLKDEDAGWAKTVLELK